MNHTYKMLHQQIEELSKNLDKEYPYSKNLMRNTESMIQISKELFKRQVVTLATIGIGVAGLIVLIKRQRKDG